ncbi:hypothetical protein [Enterococcus hirae]
MIAFATLVLLIIDQKDKK